jgi:transposase
MNDKLIEELRTVLDQRGLSPRLAALFFDVSFRTLYRWLNYEFKPTGLSRKAIKLGIQRIQRLK